MPTRTFRVQGDCQTPLINPGDVIQGEDVAKWGTDPNLEPWRDGELVVLRMPAAGGHPSKLHRVSGSEPVRAFVLARNMELIEDPGGVLDPVHAGLDLWFREDVARILAATLEAMRSSQAATIINEDYQQGFGDALHAVAVAFGVAAPSQWSAGRLPAPASRGRVIEHDYWG
jgi:hypothetical protein